jgi:RNA polymerase sigma-70 factor (ECF subfamily)
MAGLLTRYPLGEARIVETNGEPALRMRMGDQDQLVAFDLRDGRIHAIFTVMNPDKLTRIAR